MTQQVLAQGTTLKGKKYTYTIHKVLGQGSFGITYLATTQVDVDGELGHLKTSIQVAIKEFFMRDINGREGSVVTTGSQGGLYDNYRRKFINEARNISRLEHPHVVRVLEAFETNNTAYYAMEFCVGGSLDAKVNAEGGLSESVALGYFEQIASALQYMHDHKMLHLDLKPGNVMLRHDNDVAIIDFGLSKQYDADGNPESSTTIGGGTPGYAPLEQTNYRESSEFPVTMDVYALGATLYKMLAGVRPPEAADLLNQGFPADALRARQVSEATIAAIEKAMSPIKAQRYPTVARLAMALGYDISAAGTPLNEPIEAPAGADEDTVKGEENTAPVAHGNVEARVTPIAPKQPDRDKTTYDAPARPAQRPAPKQEVTAEKKKSKKWWLLLLPIAVVGVVLIAVVASGVAWYHNYKKGYQEFTEYTQQVDEDLREFEVWAEEIAAETQALDMPVDEVAEAVEVAAEEYVVPEVAVASPVEEESAWDQYQKGVDYYYGRGVTQDYAEAVKWYRKAAERGEKSAQFDLGYCYSKGIGVQQSSYEAVQWYRKGAEQGHFNAQYNLGHAYLNGVGVPKDYNEAVKWYRKSAENGYGKAQNQVGYCYFNGFGVPQDYYEAAEWYRKGAENGDVTAQYSLGYCYQHGYGVVQDWNEAAKWYRKAAAQGDTDAPARLREIGY